MGSFGASEKMSIWSQRSSTTPGIYPSILCTVCTAGAGQRRESTRFFSERKEHGYFEQAERSLSKSFNVFWKCLLEIIIANDDFHEIQCPHSILSISRPVRSIYVVMVTFAYRIQFLPLVFGWFITVARCGNCRLRSPIQQTVWMRNMTYLNSSSMSWYKNAFKHSWSPEDEPSWLLWFSDFFSVAMNMCGLSTSIGWITEI